MNEPSSDLKKFLFRVVYNLIVTNVRSDYNVTHRLVNPKTFCRRIKKNRHVINHFGSETKVLAWMVEDGYLSQTLGRNYSGIYFEITDKFSEELDNLLRLKLKPYVGNKRDARKFKKKISHENSRKRVEKLFGKSGEKLAEMSEKRLCSDDDISLSKEDKAAFLKKFKDL